MRLARGKDQVIQVVEDKHPRPRPRRKGKKLQ